MGGGWSRGTLFGLPKEDGCGLRGCEKERGYGGPRTEMVMKVGRHMADEEFETALNIDLGEMGDLSRRSRAVKDKTTAVQASINSIP